MREIKMTDKKEINVFGGEDEIIELPEGGIGYVETVTNMREGL